jgi:hypothetical protein
VPSLTRNIVSLFSLKRQGFKYDFNNDNNFISAYLNAMFYFEAKPHNGVYEIDINCNMIYHVPNKHVKIGINDTYRWHCRLGHINKNRIKKLQANGILGSTSGESFDQCESCLSGKLTKSSFSHIGERAKDLLGLVHTDVCGPFRTMSRNGERYFITFTDDFSRY